MVCVSKYSRWDLAQFYSIVKPENVRSILPVVKNYKKAVETNSLLSIAFTTLADYLWLLRGACEALNSAGSDVMLYLAAAVSDFYVPSEEMVQNSLD